jgi:iron complex outermembrane recepter protein
MGQWCLALEYFVARTKRISYALACGLMACLTTLAAHGQAREFDLPAGDLRTALDAYAKQSGIQLIYRVDDLAGLSSKGVKGAASAEEALASLLTGTALSVRRDGSNAVIIFRQAPAEAPSRRVDSTAEGAEVTSLAVVTVTAQKRPEPAQTVPISMTALSAKTIETYQIENLKDVSRLTPGLLVSAFSKNNPTIAIRGVGNTFSQMGVSKPVSVVVDDVFIPRNSAANFDLFDLDSIAILKGPQGTLFGRNVTGGAIVINTRKPSFYEHQLEAKVTLGNLGNQQVQGLANLPLNDSAALKLSASGLNRDGYGKDRLTGATQDDTNSQNFRSQLRVAASENLDVLLSADYARDRNDGRTLSSTTLGDDGDRRTSELGVPQGFSRTIRGASVRLAWDLPFGEVTSVTAYRKSRSGEDYSGVGANYTFLTAGSQSVVRDADQVGTFSQELRYASPKWAFGDFVAGVYYLDETGTRQLSTNGLAAQTGRLSSSTLSEQRVQTQSYALFLDGTAHLNSTLDLAAGIRYTDDRKKASLTRTDRVTPANSFSADGLQNTWQEWTPRVALNWRPTSDAMGYLSVTRGFTAGGYNTEASSLAAFAIPFEPETVTNVEAGVKTQWLDNRARVNLSIYQMKYEDKQELVNNTVTRIFSIANASRATVRGAELEVGYRPARWLGLSVNYAKISAVYDSFVVGSTVNTGNPLGSSPRNTYSAAADINVPVAGWGSVVGSVSYAHTDEYYTGATKDANLLVPAYGLTNASLGFETTDRKFRVLAWVKNASDTKYILTRSTQVVRSEYLGEPRTFGVTVTARF